MKKTKFIFTVLFLMIQFNAFAQTMNVTIKNISERNTDINYSVNVNYPQVDFGPDALMGVRGIAGDINNSLDSIVNSIIQDFKKQVSETPDYTRSGGGSSLEITGSGWVNNGMLLCTELVIFNNVAGMAHPMTTNTTFNYTADGLGPLNFSALFRKDRDYLNFISTFCIKNLTAKAEKEEMGDISDMILNGASADEKNFSSWVVKDDSLDIIFNPYQIAPYVVGIQNVNIALSDLSQYIDPDGPLSYMIK